jgi:hypothetical protein
MTIRNLTLAVLACATLALAAAALQGDAKPAAPPAAKPAPEQAEIDAQRPSYPLRECVQCGQALERGKTVERLAEGRLVRLCCADCAAAVEKDPKAAAAKVEKAVVAAQKAGYPLDTCVISGEKLDAMGAPVAYVHGTRLVLLCCDKCTGAVAKSPGSALEKIDKALIAKQRESYPLKTCVVTDEPLGEMGEPVDQLYGTTLVRFCCKMCVKSFKKDPEVYVAKIEAARGR